MNEKNFRRLARQLAGLEHDQLKELLELFREVNQEIKNEQNVQEPDVQDQVTDIQKDVTQWCHCENYFVVATDSECQKYPYKKNKCLRCGMEINYAK